MVRGGVFNSSDIHVVNLEPCCRASQNKNKQQRHTIRRCGRVGQDTLEDLDSPGAASGKTGTVCHQRASPEHGELEQLWVSRALATFVSVDKARALVTMGELAQFREVLKIVLPSFSKDVSKDAGGRVVMPLPSIN